MGIISSNKSIGGVSSINCQGSLNVTIGITAAPDITTNPTDIVLVLDRSGSMEGQPLADLKTGVNTFIDIISDATDGSPCLLYTSWCIRSFLSAWYGTEQRPPSHTMF